MTWFKSIEKTGIITKGMTTPVTSQGKNGQIYLQGIKGVRQDLVGTDIDNIGGVI